MSSVLAPEAPYVFTQKGTFPAPFEYDVPASLEIRPDAATALFDGTGASGNWLAALAFYDNDGNLLGRTFNPTVLAPGDVAEVTYIPPFGSAAASGAAVFTPLWETLTAPNLVVPSEMNGNPAWVHNAGSHLLNLATPTDPKIISTGLYGFYLEVVVQNAPAPPGFYARISIGSPSTFGGGTFPFEGGAFAGVSGASLTPFAQLPGNQDCQVQISNDDPVHSQTFQPALTVVRFT